MAGTSGFKGSGITDPFQTPDAPTVDSVSAGIGSASISFTAPAATGGGAITSYVASVKQGDGTSVSNTGTSSPIDISITAGGTAQFAVQAFNAYGAGQFSGYGNDANLFTGAAAYAWGPQQYGLHGTNDTINKSSPVQIGAEATWTQIDASTEHTVALKNNGTVWAWGRNSSGQLGQNDLTTQSSPVQIGALTTWSKIRGGGGYSIAIKNDGTLWAWGAGGSGRTGHGDEIARSSPVQVGSDTDWSDVFAGNAFCAALKTDGSLWVWGFNLYGHLGLNDRIYRSSPVQLGSDTDWYQASCSSTTMLVARTSGEMYAMGTNGQGRLGTNDTTSRSSPTQIGSLTNWNGHISANPEQSRAVKADGTLWVWGNGQSGNLGVNSLASFSSPVQVGGLSNWKEATCGGVAAAAVKTDGTLWAWGEDQGNLALYPPTYKSSPIQIGSETSWTNVSMQRFGSNERQIFGLLGE